MTDWTVCWTKSRSFQTMVLFTPTTTVIFDGVKLRDSLFPTLAGRTTTTFPGREEELDVVDDVVVVEVVVADVEVRLVRVVVVVVVVRDEVNELDVELDVRELVEEEGAVPVTVLTIEVLSVEVAVVEKDVLDELDEALEWDCEPSSASVAKTPAIATNTTPEIKTRLARRPPAPGATARIKSPAP